MTSKKTKQKNFLADGFDLPKLEEKVLEFWKTNRIFEKSLEKTAKRKPFTFYDGPPFATGLPHYGHILASTIKDLIPRYQTMRGRFVRRRWGWDCHGLPIEEIVERKLGISGKKDIERLGVKKFNETCRSMVLGYVAEWRKMVRRIARWVEFDDSYKTMDTDYMESVWWAFKEIHKKGLIYEGRKVLLYCPRCETPVSNFEVAMDNSYKDVTEEAVTVKFKLKPNNIRRNVVQIRNHEYANISIISWTTTPWTLPGNVALAVGKNILYAITEKDGENLVVAQDSPFGKKLGHTGENNIRGEELVGLAYEPLFKIPALAKNEKTYKIYPADFVNTEEGTGVVHTAVVYGEDDYNLGAKVGLPVVPMLDEKGKFNSDAPELIRGKYFKDSEKIIKKNLEERGLLFDRKMHQHSYPYCWRCGNVLFYNAIPAWFVNIQKIKSKLLASNTKEINWFPEHLKHGRYEKSVAAAPDWNISRNRYWGNPIPVWKCEICKREEVVGSIVELKDKVGVKNTFFFVRHGEADNNVKGICVTKDTKKFTAHLTKKGKKEIAATARKLTRQKIDLIITSPLIRAKETAEIIAKATGVKVVIEQEFHETDVGIFNGKKLSEYRKYISRNTNGFSSAPPRGENYTQIKERVLDAFHAIDKKYSGKRIVIVSHGDPLWLLKGALEGKTNQEIIENGAYPHSKGGLFEIDYRKIPVNDLHQLDLHRPYIDDISFACSCGGVMRRTPEIFDSWMEAGSMPFAEYHYPFENKKLFESRFPAQFVTEYIAQTRAWFYVMHVVSFILFGRAPFENVVTTGTILGEDGFKLSKSKNNFPDPNLVIEKYGADSLRFYLMQSVVMQADNLNFSEKGVEGAHRKVWLLLANVYNYFKTYQSSVSHNARTSDSHRLLDEWITARAEELVLAVGDYLARYDTPHATRAIQEYVGDLSTWYLRRSRRRKDTAFVQTMRECLLVSSKVIAPFMPFLAEALYQDLISRGAGSGMPESVHLADWPKDISKIKNQKSKIEQMAEIRRLASLALAKRAEAGIKVRQPLARIEIRSPKSEIRNNKELLEILKDEVNVKKIVFNSKLAEEVELDMQITSELREEGIVRELVRMIQGLRQDAKLKPHDRIIGMAECSKEIADIISKHEKLLKSEVNAKTIAYKKSAKFTAELATKLDSADIWLGIRKI